MNNYETYQSLLNKLRADIKNLNLNRKNKLIYDVTTFYSDLEEVKETGDLS